MFQESHIENLFAAVDFSVISKRYIVAKIQDTLHQSFFRKMITKC